MTSETASDCDELTLATPLERASPATGRTEFTCSDERSSISIRSIMLNGGPGYNGTLGFVAPSGSKRSVLRECERCRSRRIDSLTR